MGKKHLFKLTKYQIQGIERVIETHGIEDSINFYLDILIKFSFEYQNEKIVT